MPKTVFFRTWFIVFFPALLAVGTGTGCSSDPGTGEDKTFQPNLLIYLVDTLRSDHVGCYGYNKDTTPEIDRIAREGTLFENVHVQSNWTQPSVGSIMTSMPPLVFGSFSIALPDSMVTLAEVLKEAGYVTAGFTTTAAVSQEFGFNQGFDLYRESGANLNRSERKKRVGKVFDADTLNEMAFEWLDGQGLKEPFFLYMHSIDPHIPFDPPQEFDIFDPGYQGEVDGSLEIKTKILNKEVPFGDADRNHVIALYDGEIRFNDHEIGRLMKKLSQLDLLDRTLVVIISDHGEEFYERGKLTTGHGHLNLHEELTHVPLIMRLPGRIPSGKRVPNLISATSVMPTLIDFLDVNPPETMMGGSLLPLIEGGAESEDLQPETFCFRAKKIHDMFSIRTPARLLIQEADKNMIMYDLSDTNKAEATDIFPQLPRPVKNQWQERLKQRYVMVREMSDNLKTEKEDFKISKETQERLKALGYLK